MENEESSSAEEVEISLAKILKMISEKSNKLTIVKKEGARSEAWNRFKSIAVDGKIVEYAICDSCETVLSCKGYSTSSLSRHKCQKNKKSIQLTMDQFKKQKDLPDTVITDLNKKITIGLACDLRPLHSVSNRGFRNIAQSLVDFGAKFGHQKINDILRHPTTLKRFLPELVTSKQKEIIECLRMSPSFPKLAFTFDMWTEQYRTRHFLSFTVHYVNNAFKLSTSMLAVDEFPDIKKTTEHVRLECQRILESYFGGDAALVIQKSIAVTDGGSNMIHVFGSRLPCLCHRLNTVMTWMFNMKVKDNNDDITVLSKTSFNFSRQCPVYHALISGIKSTVTYFKQAKLNSKLKPNLKQDVCTRWNSQLTMLESYFIAKEDVKKILLEKNQLARILSINETALAEIITFLKPFQECTEAWSKEKEPTISEVVLWLETLQSHIKLRESDSQDLRNLKSQAVICFGEYFQLDDMYYMACVFDPRYKKLKFVGEEKRSQIINKIRYIIDNERTEVNVNVASVSATSICEQPSTSKKMRFEDFQNLSDSENEEMIPHELDRYLDERMSKSELADPSFEVLSFWKKRVDLPIMRKLASFYLAIPASQTSDERVFSATGSVINPRRTELKGSTLSSLTFIHKNY